MYGTAKCKPYIHLRERWTPTLYLLHTLHFRCNYLHPLCLVPFGFRARDQLLNILGFVSSAISPYVGMRGVRSSFQGNRRIHKLSCGMCKQCAIKIVALIALPTRPSRSANRLTPLLMALHWCDSVHVQLTSLLLELELELLRFENHWIL